MNAILSVILAATLAGLEPPLPVESNTVDDDKEAAAERLEFMKRSASVYTVTRADSKTPLKLLPEPVLRWTNPVSNVPDGCLVVWVGPTGRPELAAQVFIAAGSKDLWLHEFQSLSEHALTVSRGGAPQWQPQRPGIEMKPVEGAPGPAESAVKRLTQMRKIAESFEATDDFEGKSRWELRLLSKPLQRYEKSSADVLDGALFAFAHGTDPEVFLMLEARGADGQYAWHYGLAPMTAYAVKVSSAGREIWSAPHRQGPFAASEPFFILKYLP